MIMPRLHILIYDMNKNNFFRFLTDKQTFSRYVTLHI